MKKMLMITMAILALTACSKDNEQLVPTRSPLEQDVTAETDEIVEKEETAVLDETEVKSSFPVPIRKDGKEEVSFEELAEATQAALLWTYDYFNTKGIETEEEFYQMMKEKHYIKHYTNNEIPVDKDSPELLISDYGSSMLPKFTPNLEVEGFEVWPEVPNGLLVDVPIYIKLKNKDNMHAIAISYVPDQKRILGADTDFPMILE